MSWAESINPPTDDPDFRRRQSAERERLRRLAEAVEPPRLAVLDDVPMPEVPIEEQRYLASLMADGLREPDPWRTLADISDDPPRPLLLGVLEPDGPSLMYAPPGVGKGTTGAWMIVELQKLGMKPAIFDAERRPREWARRVSGLGGDRAAVVYIEPVDLGREFAG